jgi:TolB-like protein/tetratricopeptide (TPR) repeat protein
MPRLTTLLDELRKRGVVRTALLYAAAAFALLEFADIAFPRLGLSDRAVNVVLWVGLAGFPVVLIASWAVDLRQQPDEGRGRTWLSPASVIVSALLIAFGIYAGLFWTPSPTRDLGGPYQGEHSIAVLPFENVSGLPTNEAFTVGIHDDLISQISRIGSIKTISRTSVLQYRETTKTIGQIARELDVATILEGGVQRSGDRVRINVQLIEAEGDHHLWSETYDRELTATDVFTIQSEIATSVANALQATLSGAETRRPGNVPTRSLAAFERYTIGKQLLEIRTQESLRAAEEYFRQVIELDADYALAHSGLADALMILPEYDASADPSLAYEQSEAAIARALELDPDLPEALASKAWSRLIHGYAWSEAEQLLRRALEIQPNHSGARHWLSHLLSWQGKHAEAIHTAGRALESDPHSGLMRMNLSYILMDAGHFEESIALGLENQRLNPERYEQWGNLWLTYLRAEQPRDAVETMRRWAELTGRDAEAIEQVGQAFIRYARTGESQQLDSRLVDRAAFGLEDLGQVYAFVGDGDRALEALEDAVQERSGSRSVLSMKINPAYEIIRESPRFRSLLQDVGLGQAE